MADSGSPVQETVSKSVQPEAKRRKIRKGTRSCWECKRRKNRCTWSQTEDICDGCHRRGTQCIGQEFPEERVVSEKRGVSKPDDSRILRLEALVEELSRKIDSENACGHRAGLNSDDRSGRPEASIGTNHYGDIAADSSTPYVDNNLAGLRLHVLRNNTSPSLLKAPVGSSWGQFGDSADQQITPAVHALISAWPNERHHDAIINSKVTNLHPALSSACSGFQFPPSPKDLLRLPTPGTTSEAIARQLLVLGTYLQVLSAQNGQENTGSGPDYRLISSRALETASQIITHNDSLPQSLDIIECLIIEGQYYNYKGNIRRAWTILRRAVAMAQLLGLDRQKKSIIQDPRTLDAQSASRQERILFLLVHFDQYVSLALGTPPSLPDHSQIAPETMERCTPSGRMGRYHSMAAGRILHRNRINIVDVAETKEIDKILEKATACMPARWWLLSSRFDACGTAEECASLETRVVCQFAHYNIMLQLHLPLMLHSLRDKQYYYSTTAVINSSREILTRFTTFRSYHPSVSYCRGLDFFAFVASATLCLLHIYTSYESQVSGKYDGISISDLLAHQRFANRGLMEQALESIEKIAEIESDGRLSSEIIPIFRQLLAIEEEAYEGVDYRIHLPSNVEQLCDRNSQQGVGSSDTLYLDLPFCGTIRIERTHPPNDISIEAPTSIQSPYIPPFITGPFPAPSEGCFATTLPTVQPSEDQVAMVTNSCHVAESQPHIGDTYAAMPPSCNIQSMPYNGTDEIDEIQDSTSALETLHPDIMANIEEGLNPMMEASFMEYLLDMQ
ncbi:hypothetical protein F5B22DRAFT_299138 [Xylaria bambusicola]|uniref:uncharacterized protein n=1 Tax=Xylaria bambusicola TaxID=326684 RepID=UPI002008408A|nr:uncharacterized protein F5B22DRAFT_299138 [Xylaria bambusicola]KAI0512623.1 hypothetical protein F5B22DRAFT_299138 [Xylaria bambusicola]